MFTGVIESKSHEGGFLVSFTGSSPALESIIINSESGIYIGKVDAVLGNTDAPLAHVAHIDRKLDLDALIGIEVGKLSDWGEYCETKPLSWVTFNVRSFLVSKSITPRQILLESVSSISH